jgi:hypothetical protein
MSRVSSGSIVSDYGLDDRTIGVRSPAGEKDFSSNLRVQTGSGAHPPVQWVPGVLSPGVDHSPPSSVEVENEQELYLLSPQAPPWRVAGLNYIYIYIYIYIYTQTHTHTHTHACIHTYIQLESIPCIHTVYTQAQWTCSHLRCSNIHHNGTA